MSFRIVAFFGTLTMCQAAHFQTVDAFQKKMTVSIKQGGKCKLVTPLDTGGKNDWRLWEAQLCDDQTIVHLCEDQLILPEHKGESVWQYNVFPKFGALTGNFTLLDIEDHALLYPADPGTYAGLVALDALHDAQHYLKQGQRLLRLDMGYYDRWLGGEPNHVKVTNFCFRNINDQEVERFDDEFYLKIPIVECRSYKTAKLLVFRSGYADSLTLHKFLDEFKIESYIISGEYQDLSEDEAKPKPEEKTNEEAPETAPKASSQVFDYSGMQRWKADEIQEHTKNFITHNLKDFEDGGEYIQLRMDAESNQIFARGVYEGFIFTGIYNNNLDLFAWHGHTRTILDFDNIRKGNDFRSLRKELMSRNDYVLKVDHDFESVVNGIHKQHGEGWLYKHCKNVYEFMFKNPLTINDTKVQVHTLELYHNGRLVAADLGTTCGSIYTSATGFCEKESEAGKMQMYLTAALLDDLGFNFWDLGMTMKYKVDLGGEVHLLNKNVKTFYEENYYDKGVCTMDYIIPSERQAWKPVMFAENFFIDRYRECRDRHVVLAKREYSGEDLTMFMKKLDRKNWELEQKLPQLLKEQETKYTNYLKVAKEHKFTTKENIKKIKKAAMLPKEYWPTYLRTNAEEQKNYIAKLDIRLPTKKDLYMELQGLYKKVISPRKTVDARSLSKK